MAQRQKIRIVCISDTHNHAPGEGYTLPKGDILIHAGDLTNQGSLREIKKAARWLQEADFAVKIIVAGNHDLSVDQNYNLKYAQGWTVMPVEQEECRSLIRNIPGVIYLEHESTEIIVHGARLRVFGSPYSLDNSSQNWAFQYPEERGDEIWSAIHDETDVLITHTPCMGLVDESTHWPKGGCPALARALSRIKPRLHICGHHHEGRGALHVRWRQAEGRSEVVPWSDPGQDNKKQSLMSLIGDSGSALGHVTAFVNASIMKSSWSTGKQKAFNKAIVVDVNAAQ